MSVAMSITALVLYLLVISSIASDEPWPRQMHLRFFTFVTSTLLAALALVNLLS